MEYAGKPRLKLSSKKVSFLGKKQVFRVLDEDRQDKNDLLGLREERGADVAVEVHPTRIIPLLEQVMEEGRLLHPLPPLSASCALFLQEFAKLPEAYKTLSAPALYPVTLTPTLERFQSEAVTSLRARYGAETGRTS